MGRNRKKLIEKSSSIITRFDNKTLFKLCDKYNIPYDLEAEIIDNDTKKRISLEIKNIISKNTK